MESVDVYGAQRSWYSSYKSKIARCGPSVHWATDGEVTTTTSRLDQVDGNEDVFLIDEGQQSIIRLVILKGQQLTNDRC